MQRSLSATLHDGVLERVAIEDRRVTLSIDVPHVRRAAGRSDDARFLVLAHGAVSLAALAWCDPVAPRPENGDATANGAWAKLGTMRSLDWDAFAASVAASELDIVEAELETLEAGRAVLTLRGNRSMPYAWVELRVEADTITFADERGRAIALDALEAMGEAYWAAWKARQR